MPFLELTYFDAPGRGEAIRVALFMGGLAFQDHRLKFPEFAAARSRGDFPLGSVPTLTVDGVKIAQTGSILRYVAKIGDQSLYPTDPWAALLVDSALDSFNDTLAAALLPSLFVQDPAQKLAMRAEFAAGPMTRVLKYCECLLERSGGPFIAGATLSIADIVVALQVLQIRKGVLDGLDATMLEPYPRLNALVEAYGQDTRVQAYAAR